MTFKPMTYLVSFTAFVMLFMGLGGYFGYVKLAEHFLVQAYLDALPINAHVQAGQQGNMLFWREQVPLPDGTFASISASNRDQSLSIHYSGEPTAQAQPTSGAADLPLVAKEHTEDIRIDQARRYLYARVLATSNLKAKETTWLYKYDLRSRKPLRRTAVNPLLLPTPFRP